VFCELEVTSCLHEGECNCLEAVPARRECFPKTRVSQNVVPTKNSYTVFVPDEDETMSISSSGSRRETKTHPSNRPALHKNSHPHNNGLALQRFAMILTRANHGFMTLAQPF
jgi:hypothetical protein